MPSLDRLVRALFVFLISSFFLLCNCSHETQLLHYNAINENLKVPMDLRKFVSFNISNNMIVTMKPGDHKITGTFVSLKTGNLIMEINAPSEIDKTVEQTLMIEVEGGEVKYEIEWKKSADSEKSTAKLQFTQRSEVFEDVSKLILNSTRDGAFTAAYYSGETTHAYPSDAGASFKVKPLKGRHPSVDGKELLNFTFSWKNPLVTTFNMAFPSGVALVETYIPSTTTTSPNVVAPSSNTPLSSENDGMSATNICSIIMGSGLFSVLIIGVVFIWTVNYQEKRLKATQKSSASQS